MTGEEFKALRIAAGLSYRGAATAMDVAHTTIYRWETGRTRIPKSAAEMIQRLAKHPPRRPSPPQ